MCDKYGTFTCTWEHYYLGIVYYFLQFVGIFTFKLIFNITFALNMPIDLYFYYIHEL